MARPSLPSLKRILAGILLASCTPLFCPTSLAAAKPGAHAAPAPQPSVTALLVSDVHFEPFWDPAKVPQLAAAPVSGWKAIFAAPASPDQAARFAATQQSCKTRGEDTDYALLASSLAAMRAHAPRTRFLTISGDLISHAFPCKWAATMPNATPQEYEAFVEKTLEFVLGEFRAEFPAAPVYAALGNNDSGCADYRIDANGSFLAASAAAFTGKLPQPERKAAEADFAAGGNFSASLPAPFRHTRLVIIDDLFQSRKYQTCAGKDDSTGAEAQIAWLRGELDKARANHEQVWVMGHIPPGIDPYSTASKMKNVCGGKDPEFFLSSDELANTLAGYGDVIRLAIFAHTHMDEMRLLEPFPLKGKALPVPLKMVPSISPVDGNNPSFTIASVDPRTATLRDYRVIAASNQSGVDTKWAEEYDYARAYHKPAYSPTAVEQLVGAFQADPDAKSPESESYLRNYFVRDQSLALKLFWPQYTCALSNFTADAYHACRCPAAK
jgi:sphingomyelin phosphodiesterase acid-like 3